MKKFILFTAISVIFFCSLYAFGGSAAFSASVSRYAMVVTDGAKFYADASGKVERFIVDKSYFVSVVDTVGEFTRVVFMDSFDDCPSIEGYVKTVDVAFYDNVVSSPYPDVTLKAVTDVVLFSDSAATKPRAVISAGSTVRYFGVSAASSDDFYVYGNGSVGYVARNAFESFYLPLSAEYVAMQTPRETSDKSPSSITSASASQSVPADDRSPVEIVLITLAIIVVLIFVYLIVRPDKLSQKKAQTDDDY